jgi:hypothetical protein
MTPELASLSKKKEKKLAIDSVYMGCWYIAVDLQLSITIFGTDG